MTCKEFDELSDRIKRGVASAQEAEAFVTNATELRAMAIYHISRTDTWDEDWEVLSYWPYGSPDDKGPDDCDDCEAIREWTKTLTGFGS